LHKGIKVRVVNAEFLFSDLRVPKGDRWDFVAEEQQQDLKSAILTLLNRVMSKNGRLYITDFVDNMRGVKEKLTGAGFVVDKEEMVTKEKAKVWWAKEGFRRAKKDGDQGWLPIRLVARKIKEVPTEKKPT
jgi:hypothetical protein